jgi:hypothetical protein
MNHPKEFASSGSGIIQHAAIYVRVSSGDQGKGFSIPTQIEACQKLAKRHFDPLIQQPRQRRMLKKGSRRI